MPTPVSRTVTRTRSPSSRSVLTSSRSLTRSAFAIGPRSNPWVYAGIAGVVLLQLGFVYLPVFHFLFGSAPIGASEWLRSVLAAAVVIPAVEAYKAYRLRVKAKARPRERAR